MRFHFVETMEEANEFCRWLSERRVVACDTETTGLSPENDRIRTIQFGDSDEGWCLPCEGRYSWAGLATDILKRFDGTLIFHNAKFDLRHIERSLGVAPTHLRCDWHDTSLLANLGLPGSRMALKPLARELLGEWADDPQGELAGAYSRTGWKWDSVPVDHPSYWRYATLDTVLTHAVFQRLKAWTTNSLYALECAVLGVCYDMERRGALLDAEYTESLGQQWESDVENILCWAKSCYGDGFNLFSGPQLAAALVSDGVQLVERTPSGNQFKTDESVLSNIDHPLARACILAKRLRKWSTVYLDSFQHSARFDGAVHCSIRTVGARTGRMSITDPPMQTLPSGSFVRDCIIPRPGNVLVSVDYDAVEMRGAAHLSGDRALIERLMNGESIHDYAAAQIYGEGYTQDQRQYSKNGGYAIMYGAGAKRLSHTLGISEPDAQRFKDQWLSAFPQLKAKIEEITQIGRLREREEGDAYVNTILGRKVIVRDKTGRPAPHKMVNAWIQGSAADLLKQKLVELDQAGFGDYMLLPIHDEVLFDVPRNEVDTILPEIERVMTVEGLTVPWTVHGEVCYERWGDKYRGTDPSFDTGTFLDPDSVGED